jgi:hypothetical protein
LWQHRRGPVEPPLRLTQIRYDADGNMRYPHHDDRAPESALARYLQEAAAVFGAAEPPDLPTVGQPISSLSADFEHLRWFELPEQCLAPFAAVTNGGPVRPVSGDLR